MQPVSALLLAAGSSSRMGRTKQLLPLGEKNIIGHCIDTLRKTGIDVIVLVLGHAAGDVAASVRSRRVSIAVTGPGEMADSVRTGLSVIESSASVLVCLADHPLVSAATIRSMLALHDSFPDCVIVPEFEGRRGHPVLFPRPILDEIRFRRTMREIVRGHEDRVRIVTVRDRGVILDMDTPRDYETVVNLFLQMEQKAGDNADGV